MPFFERGSGGSGANDSTVVADSSAVDTVAAADSLHADSVSTTSEVDTTKMDSLELAIYKHNKHIDDSIRLDSINRKKANSLDAPVTLSSEDSLVYNAATKDVRLFGNSNVKYQNMDLKSDRIQMNLDSNLVHATGTADTTAVNMVRSIFISI